RLMFISLARTVTLRCEITDRGDTEWVYEWSTSGPELPQEQSEYLTIRVEFFSSRQYYCKGKHKEDKNMETEWSNSMSLKASFIVTAQKPQAHLTSDTTSIQQGSSVTLTCSVRSSSGWKYYWYKDNTLYKPHTTQDFSDNPQISVSVGGSYRCRGGRGNPVYYTYDSNTVSISTIGESVNTIWTCFVLSGIEMWFSKTHNKHSRISRALHILYKVTLGKGVCILIGDCCVFSVSNGAVVTLDPNWSEIYTGEKITLRCEIHRGDTEWEYEWRKSDSALSETESEIRITKAHSDHTGDYSCRGKMKQSQDHSTNWSNNVTLTVTVDMDSSVSLRVSPNRSQHFTYESISLSCETNSDKWRVRQFYKNSYSNCDNYSWRTDTSPCIISRTVYNGAVFWCESGSGELSSAVNISTHDDIILESPVHPVTEGQPLILSCRLWTDAILADVSFYKNGKVIQNGTSEQLSISAVSKSDEGFYKCERKEVLSRRVQVWMSSESWVSVKCECT
uniref:Ig-like domain-containing protein n=1 Tax=Sphaeramia orbicularis TaxID=375764 RepID=A0A672Y7K8_9TELE